MSFPCPYCSVVETRGHALEKHLRGRRLYGGHQLSKSDVATIVLRLSSGPSKPETTLVRPGHWRSLELLENTRGARDTLAMYERATGHSVYLRPTQKGLTVMSLDPATPAMVGLGGHSAPCLDVVPPTPDSVEAAAQAYRAKLAAMLRDSAEERYVMARIRAALSQGLELREDLLFLHHGWRFPSAGKIDILALDRGTGQLVVVEAKKSEAAALRDCDHKGRTAAEQAANYVARLTAHAAECMHFFQRLASALSRIYRADGADLFVDTAMPARWELWWPEGRALSPRR